MAADASTPRTDPEQTAEHRWPAAIAILAALILYATLPSSFTPALRYVVVGLCLAMFIPLLALNPHHLQLETRWSKWLNRGLIGVLLAANLLALVQLVYLLVAERAGGPGVLLAALQVWVTNVIAFALVFWEMDRGGPIARRLPRSEAARRDFLFPQDQVDDPRASVWAPGYVDYLYFSASNSMAFSPTDVMPLSHSAKLLMAVEAFSGFVILALVIARAVNLLA